MGFGRCFDQEELCADGEGGESRDHSVLTLEGVGEGVERIVVDWDGGDGVGKFMTAALASKDCYFKASVEECVEDGRAKVASGLRGRLASVFWNARVS